MPEVRFIGGVLGSIALVVGLAGVRRHRRRGILRLRDYTTLGVGVALLSLGLAPQWFDYAAALFGVESLEGRRLAIVTILGYALLGVGLFMSVGRIGRLQDQVSELALELAVRTPVSEQELDGGQPFIAAVIPAFNEEGALPTILRSMPKEVDGIPVRAIVVSDGSTDGTVRVAADLADVVLERPLRRGSGAAVRTGVEFALSRGAVVIVTLDADGQHDPRELPSLVRPLLAGEADMVQGARRVNSSDVSGHPLRALGVRFFSSLFRIVFGINTNDPSNGFRAIRAESYRRLALIEDQFYVGELIVRSARANLRIIEMPVTVSPRSHGESKKPGPLLYGWGFTLGLIKAFFQGREPRR